jgi:TatD DNase family protein
MELIDTHAHLDDEALVADIADVLARALQSGVTTVLAVGTTAGSSERAVSLSARWPQVYAAVGIQPNYGAEASAADWDRIAALSAESKVRAIGETGLDAHWDYTPMDLQRRLFAQHLQLAQESDLPVIVHMRDCEAEVVEMLRCARAQGPLRGVMHSFTGELGTAEACLELGLHISFAGMVTYKTAEQLRRIARQIPADRLLIETDAPYLAPHPHRGRRPNEPFLLVHTARCLAEVREVCCEQLAAETTANARRLFRF